MPYQVFEAADGHLILAVGNDAQFRRFCALAGLQDLANDARFASNEERVRHREELIPIIASTMRLKGVSAWLDLLGEKGIPAGPINDIRQAFSEEQALFRKISSHLIDEDGTQIPTVRSPLRLSATPTDLRIAPPRVGQHTQEILSEVAGLDDDAIEALVSASGRQRKED